MNSISVSTFKKDIIGFLRLCWCVHQHIIVLTDISGKDQCFIFQLQFDTTSANNMTGIAELSRDFRIELHFFIGFYNPEKRENFFCLLQIVQRFRLFVFGKMFFISFFGFLFLDFGAVQKYQFGDVFSRTGAINFTFKPLIDQSGQPATMV